MHLVVVPLSRAVFLVALVGFQRDILVCVWGWDGLEMRVSVWARDVDDVFLHFVCIVVWAWQWRRVVPI